MRCFILLQLLFIFKISVYAQYHFDFEHLDIKDGLSQNSPMSMLQDKKGFIWIGTEDGLNRYDGREFKVFRHEVQDVHSIPSNFVKYIFEDKENRLWLVHTKSLSFYNPLNENFEEFRIPNFAITHIMCASYVEASNEIWIGTLNETWIFNLSTQKFRTIQLKNVKVILPINKNELIVAVSNKIFTINLNQKTTKELLTASFPIDNMYYLKWKNQILGLSEQNEVFLYHLAKREITYKHIFNKQSVVGAGIKKNIVFSDSKNQLYIGTNKGLIFYPNIDGKPEHLRNDLGNNKSISKNDVMSILEDKSGIIWIGTYGGGINKLNFSKNTFHTYSYNPNDKNTVSSNYILSFAQDSTNTIWIGTDGAGINKWNKENNKFTHFATNKEKLNDEAILNILPLQDKLLLATSLGLKVFNTKTNSSRIVHFENTVKHNAIKCIYKCMNGNILAGGTDGLFLVDISTYKLKRIAVLGEKYKNVRAICQTPDATVWIATVNGLVKWQNNNVKHYFNTVVNGETEFNISSIAQVDSTLWLGILGSGIIGFNYISEQSYFYNTKNGLSNNLVYGVVPDNAQNLWISTNLGLSKFSLLTKTFTNYSVLDGLQSNEFNGGAFFKTKEGQLLFGGVEGFNYFDPKLITNNKVVPKVCFTDIKLFDKPLNVDSILQMGKLVLAYSQNYLSFNFAALEFTAPQKNQYAFLLDGYDYNWIYGNNFNMARYNNLAPGEYVLKVKASNNDGVWSTQILSLPISIIPPFWSTWLFRSALICFVILSIWLVLYQRIRAIRRKEEEKTKTNKRLSELELRALRAQMNPHFIFNALNSIQDFIINNNVKQASKSLSKFAKLIRQILDNSENNTITLAKKIDFLKLYIEIESLRFDNQFNYKVSVDSQVNIYQIEIPTMLIQPFIENAIWHGLMHQVGERNLEIKFYLGNKQTIHCEIIDNGIGRKQSELIKDKQIRLHTSKGISLTHERLKILNKLNATKTELDIIDLYDESGKSAGTKVILTIPYKIQHD